MLGVSLDGSEAKESPGGWAELRRRRRAEPTKTIIVAAWLLVSMALLGASQFYLRQELGRTEREAGARLLSLALAVEQSMLRTIEAVEELQNLVQTRADMIALGNAGGQEAVERILLAATETERFGVLQVAVISAAGQLVWSTVEGWQPVDLNDRRHFLVHARGELPPGDVYVSEPLVGRASARWSVQLTRALTARDGSFGGVVVVSLDPVRLSQRLAAIRSSPDEVYAILRLPDGVLLARSRNAEEQLARRAEPGHVAVVAAATARTGANRARSVVDGREVLAAHVRLDTLPVVVVAAQDWAQAIEQHAELQRWVMGSLVASLLVMLVAALLVRQLAQTRRAEQAFDRAQQARAATERASTETARLLAAAPAALVVARLDEADGAQRPAMPRLVSANFERLTGWQPEGLLANWHLPGPLDEAGIAARRRMLASVRTGAGGFCEYRLRQPDGGERWLREEARLERNPADGTEEVISYLADISEQRRLGARAQAAARLATLGEMAASMAHELNQPLAVISLAAENASGAIEEGSEKGLQDALETLELIADQSARCKSLVQHLRSFSRGGERLSLRPLHVMEALKGARLLTQAAMREAGVTLEVDLPPELPRVLADLVATEQVFVNLLLNARDAIRDNPPERPRRIVIAAMGEEAELVVTFRDSGTGIAGDALDRLFEPFFTTKAQGQGTGLGLAICQGTMIAQGGSITAENLDGGARFTLRFRLAPEAASAAPGMVREEDADGHAG